MFSIKDKNLSVRVYSEYKEICKILIVQKIASMVFLVDETYTKMAFLPLGATLCFPKSIIIAQIHVKLVLTHLVLAKVLHQQISSPTGFWMAL